LLQHHLVVEHAVNLSSIFTIYSPWKSIHVAEVKYPILLCINHLKLEKSTFSSSLSLPATQENSNPLCSQLHPSHSQSCESLLQALESSDESSGVSLAATIQRIYQSSKKNRHQYRWEMLCEDAFGIFFELEIGS
uniref:Uncharacterized protein n=1 Tax=Ciona savignyi TaxID=51511 RepID=H2YBZ2_CIOSA